MGGGDVGLGDREARGLSLLVNTLSFSTSPSWSTTMRVGITPSIMGDLYTAFPCNTVEENSVFKYGNYLNTD